MGWLHAVHCQRGIHSSVHLHSHQESPSGNIAQYCRTRLQHVHSSLGSLWNPRLCISMHFAKAVALLGRPEVHRHRQVGQLCRHHQHRHRSPSDFDTPYPLELAHFCWKEVDYFFSLHGPFEVCLLCRPYGIHCH